ncbi:hypothetical protein [Candidatus Sodalis pierantonius]|uniref:hypothetical protein n=1 Tax=Candidatus Sodalis pierantonii TaxID=1486991 RepID=UPI00046D7682|nr:hypothetical protein [Candidatus Sodalis pierantonius]
MIRAASHLKVRFIQQSRFISLFFHYRFYLRDNDEIGTSVWDIILGKGIIGVDVFFVISGFIMVYTTHYYPHGFQSSKKFFIILIELSG